MKAEFEHRLVTWEEDGTVLYNGRVCGQIYQTGKYYNNGRDPLYMAMNATGHFYCAQAAAIAEAQATQEKKERTCRSSK